MMTILIRTMVFVVLVTISFGASAQSHCKKGEIDYFTCKIKGNGKIVSLCGSPFRDSDNANAEWAENAWIQYRFGKMNQPELVYPKKMLPIASKFTGEYVVANDRRLYALMFQNDGYSYEVQSSPGFRGVVVEGRGSRIKMPCDGEPKMALGEKLNNFYQLVQDLNGQR